MAEYTVVQHPLVQHFLTELRDQRTVPINFRAHVRRLSALLAYEATRDLSVTPRSVRTPLAECDGCQLMERVALVPILRAGLGMVDAVLEMLPDAEVRHLGYYRDESTLQPVKYYNKLPASDPPDVALVLDPMLATGGSAVAAIDSLRTWGANRVKLLTLLAAPEGIARVGRDCPGTLVLTCAVDSHLNEHGYIVPGLGDAGDRMCNTAGH